MPLNAIRAVNAALAVLVAVLSLLLVRHYTTEALKNIASGKTAGKAAGQAGGQAGEKSPAPRKETAARGLPSYAPILDKNPFGKNPAGPLTVIEGISIKDAPQAVQSSDLTLVGTIAGEGRYGFAIFEDKKREQAIIRVSSEIPGVGRLQSVRPDSATIMTPAGRIKLELAKIIKTVEEKPSAQEVKTPAAAGDKKIVPAKEVAFIKQTGKQDFVLDREGVQESLKNPQRVLTDARMLPNMVDGKQTGFKVSEVKGGGIYDKLGLRNGDILLKINALDLNSPDSGIQAFSTLKGADRITLNIIRNEQKITMSYQVQ